MNRHLSLRSGNPALKASTFKQHLVSATEGSMSISGTVNKTGFSLLLVIMAASITWNNPTQWGLVIFGLVVGIIAAILTITKPKMGYVSVPIYALSQGLVLGAISRMFELQYPGIAVQAIFLTFGTLGALLLAYKSGLIKVTENFKLGIVAATGGVAIVYLINFVMGFFGSGIGVIHSSSNFGILFSLLVVGIAALNLVLDFDFIEEGAEMGAPKYMEWYGAFGLLVTLIWLYLELLRLLAKLQDRR
ncbi:MAG: Bax inhibitor-1/YccA family protein [Candidatus Marinimicrobia bacterium]|nr:Bax inhibitor-1/YccA family protein [Candidatus Neomarinimicrobiota bacterium]